MTDINSNSADDPFDRETFRIELAELVDHACETGVDIEGAYDVRSPRPDDIDYTVEISRVVDRVSFS